MGEAGDGEFAEVGLAQQNCASVSQVGNHGGVGVWHEVGGDARAAGGADALGPDLVLDPHRDAVHGAAVVARQDFLFGLPGFFEGPFSKHSDEGVELEVEVVDALQVGLDHLHRGRLSALDEAG